MFDSFQLIFYGKQNTKLRFPLRVPDLLKDEILKLINCRAKRHPYSMFDVGRSMFDVHL
jgi:hypothetical protein